MNIPDNMEVDGHRLKVIAVTNEDEPYEVGDLVGWWTWQGGNKSAIVEIDGEDKIHMGIVFPYSTEMEELLKTIPAEKQWAFVRHTLYGYKEISNNLPVEQLNILLNPKDWS